MTRFVKYNNRKYYGNGRYYTMRELLKLDPITIQVVDHRTKNDITQQVLKVGYLLTELNSLGYRWGSKRQNSLNKEV